MQIRIRLGVVSADSDENPMLTDMCHAKSQFGLITQIGVTRVLPWYTTRSLTGGIGGF